MTSCLPGFAAGIFPFNFSMVNSSTSDDAERQHIFFPLDWAKAVRVGQ